MAGAKKAGKKERLQGTFDYRSLIEVSDRGAWHTGNRAVSRISVCPGLCGVMACSAVAIAVNHPLLRNRVPPEMIPYQIFHGEIVS